MAVFWSCVAGVTMGLAAIALERAASWVMVAMTVTLEAMDPS